MPVIQLTPAQHAACCQIIEKSAFSALFGSVEHLLSRCLEHGNRGPVLCVPEERVCAVTTVLRAAAERGTLTHGKARAIRNLIEKLGGMR